MDWKTLFSENEKPLDRIPEDGGLCSIFRTIGCVGDSLSSGEFETHMNGKTGWHDMYEYSWGQFIGRSCGSKVYNFSRGGMTAKEYIETFADANRFWDPAKACQAYIVALGVNDVLNQNQEIGNLEDIKENLEENGKTFIGYYAAIIQKLKKIQPRAKFFLVNTPKEDRKSDADFPRRKKAVNEAIAALADYFDNAYLIDLYTYGPEYDDEFREKFCMSSHLNPLGYWLTGKMIAAYIDYIVRQNLVEFKQVGFIGTSLYNDSVPVPPERR